MNPDYVHNAGTLVSELGCKVSPHRAANGLNTLESEPRREKTVFLHMRKQRRRSASR